VSLAHKNRKIVDRVGDIVLTLGIGRDFAEARVEWYDDKSIARIPYQCWIDSNLLLLGRWVPTQEGNDVPPIAVVCRATALAVGAAIKADVMRAVEGLP
jgi:hypothetical protein